MPAPPTLSQSPQQSSAAHGYQSRFTRFVIAERRSSPFPSANYALFAKKLPSVATSTIQNLKPLLKFRLSPLGSVLAQSALVSRLESALTETRGEGETVAVNAVSNDGSPQSTFEFPVSILQFPFSNFDLLFISGHSRSGTNGLRGSQTSPSQRKAKKGKELCAARLAHWLPYGDDRQHRKTV
jgi:hypothetical protein